MSSFSSKWVCPNDRQLALRAQLHTGWSMHGTSDQKNIKPISDDEQAHILHVIEKANNIDNGEAIRVGRLVDRLDNIKKSALGTGIDECLLCAHSFGLLSSATSNVCIDCKKNVCTECSINMATGKKSVKMYLCKICAESRELWKRSGAWFFKSIPNYILPEPKKIENKHGRSWRPMTNPVNVKIDATIKTTTPGNLNSCNMVNIKENESKHDYIVVKHRKSYSSDEDSETDSLKIETVNVVTSTPIVEKQPLNNVDNFDSVISPLKIQKISNNSLHSIDSGNLSSDTLEPTSQTSPLESIDLNNQIIVFTLIYISSKSSLTCELKYGKNLKTMDRNGFSDPYAIISLIPTLSTIKFKSSTKKKTLNPEWDESFDFFGINNEDLHNFSLLIEIRDEDLISSDFIGQVVQPLKNIERNKLQFFKLNLCDFKRETKIVQAIQDRGRIEIGLMFSKAPKNELIVKIVKCSRLIALDKNGFSDPYVKVYLMTNNIKDKKSKCKTIIKRKTLNPEYNEEFCYNLPSSDLVKKTLEISVWDYDITGSNELIGRVIFGQNCKITEAQMHWVDVMRNRGKYIQRWHVLQLRG